MLTLDLLRLDEKQMELGFFIEGDETDGVFLRYDRRGNLLLKAKYKNHRMVGDYIVWWQNGNVKIKKKYDDEGKVISHKEYNEKGELAITVR